MSKLKLLIIISISSLVAFFFYINNSKDFNIIDSNFSLRSETNINQQRDVAQIEVIITSNLLIDKTYSYQSMEFAINLEFDNKLIEHYALGYGGSELSGSFKVIIGWINCVDNKHTEISNFGNWLIENKMYSMSYTDICDNNITQDIDTSIQASYEGMSSNYYISAGGTSKTGNIKLDYKEGE